MIYADQRWIGPHGIGCFAQNVLATFNYRRVPLTGRPASALDTFRLSRFLAKLDKWDLFYSPGYNSPVVSRCKFAFTIHDLNHLDRPENSSRLKRLYYSTVLKSSCHRAVSIFTVSEYSRSRIAEWSGVPQQNIVNVGCGVSPAFHGGVARHTSSVPYLLCVSNRKKHKNEFRTIDAFAQAKLPKEMQLTFTGESTPELERCIRAAGVSERVRFTGYVHDRQLPCLYAGSTALIFASLYEGFGLPILEGMACGTPVVTSCITAMPETAGGAALLVDPQSVEEITNAMERVVFDNTLRSELRAKGFVNAAQYSWLKTSARVRDELLRFSTAI